MTELKVGQSLTPEQVRNLPDGAGVEIYGSKANAPFKIVLRDYEHKAYIAKELEYFCLCCNIVSLPTAPSEPNRRIEPQAEPAKPELPVRVSTCDRCGTIYLTNERHACPPPFTKPDRQACDYCDCGYKPENCKGCRPEPAKPERQASEIEKLAAWALLTDISPELHRLSSGDCGHTDAVFTLVDLCHQYIEAYDYAKSIGAIE